MRVYLKLAHEVSARNPPQIALFNVEVGERFEVLFLDDVAHLTLTPARYIPDLIVDKLMAYGIFA